MCGYSMAGSEHGERESCQFRVSEWRHKQQRFGNDREGGNEYPELFRNEVTLCVVEEFSKFSAKSHDDVREIKESIVFLARVDAGVATIV